MSKQIKRVAALLAAMSFFTQAQTVILTGQIKASDNQTFYSPKTDSWRVQVQWMLPEGDVAQKGDVVVVFDSGSIQTQIEQEETSLIAAEEEYHRLTLSGKQSILEADFAKKRTALLLQRARIDAAIPVEHLSQFDYENNQLELEKAVVADAKAQDKLTQAKLEDSVALDKQKLTIEEHKRKLAYNQSKLKQMSVVAERTGPVIYGTHPWNGEKVFVGMTAQPSWNIAEIPALKGLYIEAWVHEVDFKHLKLNQQVSLTFDAFPEHSISAKLSEVTTQPEERNDWGKGVYYRSQFSFDVPKTLNLLPGMSAKIIIQGDDHG